MLIKKKIKVIILKTNALFGLSLRAKN